MYRSKNELLLFMSFYGEKEMVGMPLIWGLARSHQDNISVKYVPLIYWLLCFEQVSNKHIHLLNKGSFGGRCISFPPFIIHRCIISGGKLIHRSLISGGKLISRPVDIRCYFYIRLNKR